jgi:hypothetical protein
MSKIIPHFILTLTILSILILLVKLVISKNVISKIITLSTSVNAIFIAIILMQFVSNIKYTSSLLIVYTISQFTITLHTLYLIKNNGR